MRTGSDFRLSGIQFILAIVVLWSCKKDVLPVAEVSKTKVEVFAGIADTVSILSVGNNWQVSSDDEAIATANTAGNKVVVVTHKSGKTIVHLWNEERRVRIEVIANPLSGGWYIMLDRNTAPLIEAEDAAAATAIEEELMHDENNRIKRSYVFSNNGKCHIQAASMVNHEEHEEFEGSFSLQNSVLTVSYNNFDHIYTLQNPPAIRFLKQDLTSYYQQKFPDSGVKKVTIVLVLQYFTYG
ncbi:MAG: hypothetical protein ACTHMM_26435 [Agriterribacter sp.]